MDKPMRPAVHDIRWANTSDTGGCERKVLRVFLCACVYLRSNHYSPHSQGKTWDIQLKPQQLPHISTTSTKNRVRTTAYRVKYIPFMFCALIHIRKKMCSIGFEIKTARPLINVPSHLDTLHKLNSILTFPYCEFVYTTWQVCLLLLAGTPCPLTQWRNHFCSLTPPILQLLCQVGPS